MSSKSNVVTVFQRSSTSLTVFHAVKTKKAKLQSFLDFISKGLGAIRAKIGPTSDVDKIFSKMYSQYVLFRNKYN
jgi:hypothetical protein